MIFDPNFYKGKRVFITGHTGFKGSWLCRILVGAGAVVTGYALPAPTEPDLFALASVQKGMTSVVGDIRSEEDLRTAFEQARPEIVFHLAAQPLVRESYRNPVDTYAVNVMGTVHLLECIRTAQAPVRSECTPADELSPSRSLRRYQRDSDSSPVPAVERPGGKRSQGGPAQTQSSGPPQTEYLPPQRSFPFERMQAQTGRALLEREGRSR